MDKHWHETEHHFFERAADHSFDDITVGVDEGVDLALEFTRGRTIWEKGHSVDTQLSVFYIEITAQNIIDILKGNSLRVGSIAFGDEEPDGDPEVRLHSGNWKLLDDGDFTVYTRNGAAFWIDTQTDGGGNILLKAGESLLLKGNDAIEIGEEGTNAPVSVLSSNFRLVDSGEGVAIESYGPAGINLDATEGNGAVNIDSRTGTTIDGTLIPRNSTLATTTLLAGYLPLAGGTLTGPLTATKFVMKGGTATQFLKADGSVDSSSYIKLGTIFQTNNSFAAEANRNFFISKISNRMFAANKRFVVTHQAFDAGGNKVADLITNIFDGDYEHTENKAVDGTRCELYIGIVPEVDLDTTNSQMWTYAGGTILLSFYSTWIPDGDIRASFFTKGYTNVARGWYNCAVTRVGTSSVFSVAVPGYNYFTAFKVEYNGKTYGSYSTGIMQVEYHGTRSRANEEVSLTKYPVDQTMYGNLYTQYLYPEKDSTVDLGRSDRKWNRLFVNNIYEGGTQLSSKYLAIEGLAKGLKLSAGRMASADALPSAGAGAVEHFIATSAMTTHKPCTDGHILQFIWDNNPTTAKSQLFIPDSQAGDNFGVQWRAGKTYTNIASGEWRTLLDTFNWGQHVSLETIVGSDLAASIKLVATLFERDANGDVRVRNNAGLYSNSFISAGGVSDEDRSAPVHLLEPAAGTQPDNFIFPDYSSATDRFALSAALGYQLDSRTAALEERFVVGTEEEIAAMTKVPGKFYCTYEDE